MTTDISSRRSAIESLVPLSPDTASLVPGARAGEQVLEHLYRVTLAMQTSWGREERLAAFTRGVQEVVGFDRVSVLLAPADGTGLELARVHGEKKAIPPAILPLSRTAGPFYQAFQTRRPVAVLRDEDLEQILPLDPSYRSHPSFRTRRFVIAPLVVGGRTIGVAGADNKPSRRPIALPSVEPFRLLCQLLATALEETRLQIETQSAGPGNDAAPHRPGAPDPSKPGPAPHARRRGDADRGARRVRSGLRRWRQFSPEEQKLMSLLADQAAIAIRNAQLFACEREARTEAELSDRRFRDLVQSLDAIVWEAEAATGQFSFVSQRAEAVLGYPLERWLTEPEFWVAHLHPDDRADTVARCRAAISERRDYDVEYRLVAADGRVVWLRDRVHVARDAAGCARQLCGVMVDITERKRLQEELIQAEKLATLGELIAGIAHELNNPLAALTGHAQLLRIDQKDAATAARVERVLDAAQRASQVVRNFLTFARKHRPEKVPVSVNEIITKTLELLAYQLRVNNIQVQTALTPGLPSIAADPHQLQQVLLNLLNNASHAMVSAHGRGTLRVASALSPDGGTLTVIVTDDGPGISPEHQPRILDPFFTTKPPGEGTGLGLTIARGIVTEHGGTITVEGEPGHGATFIVTLPIPQVPLTPTTPAEPMAMPTGLRVLVVDDEAALRELMADALAGLGNRVETAADSREALEVLARAPVDVLVLDVKMPGMSGPELWSVIHRTDPALARRIVFCTGSVVGEKTRAFLDSTGCPTVAKPFDLSQFFDAVARAARLRGEPINKSGDAENDPFRG